MRVYVLALFSAICLSAVLPALATPIAPSGAIITPVSKIVTVAHHCGKGRYWIPAGYAKLADFADGGGEVRRRSGEGRQLRALQGDCRPLIATLRDEDSVPR